MPGVVVRQLHDDAPCKYLIEKLLRYKHPVIAPDQVLRAMRTVAQAVVISAVQ